MKTQSIVLLPLLALLALAVGCSTVAPRPAPVDQPLPAEPLQEPVAEPAAPVTEPAPPPALPAKIAPPGTISGRALADGAFAIAVVQRTDGPWRQDGTRERALFSRFSKRYDGVRQIIRTPLPSKILKASDADFWPATAAHLATKKIQAALVIRIAIKPSLPGVNERKREQGIAPQDAHVVWESYCRDGATLVPSAEGDAFVDSTTLDAYLPTIADAVLDAD